MSFVNLIFFSRFSRAHIKARNKNSSGTYWSNNEVKVTVVLYKLNVNDLDGMRTYWIQNSLRYPSVKEHEYERQRIERWEFLLNFMPSDRIALVRLKLSTLPIIPRREIFFCVISPAGIVVVYTECLTKERESGSHNTELQGEMEWTVATRYWRSRKAL